MSDRADKSKPHGATCQHKKTVIVFLLSIQVATMANRGGGHRRKVEDVDLYSLLEDHVKSHGLSRALQFGIYENIDRTQAAFAAGLAYNSDLLKKVS